MFEDIAIRNVDQLMALMQDFRADPRERKVDLVVGVYKDEAGAVPIMSAVRKAQQKAIDGEDTKNYVGPAGDPDLRAAVPAFVLGQKSPAVREKRTACVHTPGGSGALRVGFDLLASINPGQRIFIGTPTWINHMPIAQASGLTVLEHPYFRPADRGLDFAGMMDHLGANARAGDALLLHACCHNPTGVDLEAEHWATLCEFANAHGVTPFIDFAYQGLGNGIEEDAAGPRMMAERVPELMIASSFSKNFGIYRERCGALTVIGRSPDSADAIMTALQTVIRSNYSMPPSLGARIVATIFADAELRAEWEEELAAMRQRVALMRERLRSELEARQVRQDVSFLTAQNGMFSYTGLAPEQVVRLREEFGVYMAGDGRINVAGLSEATVGQVADGFAAVLAEEAAASSL